jgi:hypothetical protein
MTRRELFKKLILTPIAGAIGYNIKPMPSPSFCYFSGEDVQFGRNPLHGIPYHQSNASVGEWLGFTRK